MADLMPGPSIDPLSQLLGAIDAKLGMVLKTQSEDREASAKYRTDIRRDLVSLTGNVQDLKNRVNSNADELAEVLPMVASHQRWIDQWEGASKLTKIIWAVMTTLGIGGLVALFEAFRKH